MKRKLLKVLGSIMMMVMVLSMFSACGTDDKEEVTSSGNKTTESKKDDSDGGGADELEPVTLKFIFFGDKRTETDAVWAAIADEYRDVLNADFEITFIPGSEYGQKLSTMAASGDDWDMNFDGEWLSYSQLVGNGAYLDLSDLLPEYAPTLYATYMEQGTLGAATTGGEIVSLPWTMSMNQRPYFRFRSDIIDLENDTVKTVEDLDAVLVQMSEDHPDKYLMERAFKQVFLAKYELLDLGFQNYVIGLNDPDLKVMPLEATDAYKDLATYAKKWQDADIIRKDVLIDDLDGNALIREGKMISNVSWHEWVFANDSYTDENAEVGYSLLYPENKYANRSPLANLVAINANAKNPERALMFLELLETDQKMYDMVQYGIEGTTYVLEGEAAAFPDGVDPNNSNYMNWGGQWALWKPQFMRPTDTYGDGFWKAEADFAALPMNVPSPLNGFFPDTSNVETEIASRSQVWQEYNRVIEVGLVPDAMEYLQKMNDAMADAGVDAITADLQAQVDAFVAK